MRRAARLSFPGNILRLALWSATATNTADGIGWLTVTPANGTLAPGSNPLTVQTDLSGLGAGVHTGTVRVAFDDGSVGSIQVIALARNTC